jgi:glycosyltransferase involved in cell wall biosynthesis
MRLLMVTSSYPKFAGDVTAPFIEQIARGLVARGHSIDTLLPEHPQLRRPDEAGLRFFPFRYAPDPRLCLWGYAQSLEADVRVRPLAVALAPVVAVALRRALVSRLEQRRYDAALLHWVIPNAAVVVDILRSYRLPYVVSLHGSDVFLAERGRLLGLLARQALAGAGVVTACSGDLARRATRLGAAPARVRTLPYGVDVGEFDPARRDDQFRRRHGLPDDALLVLAVGRLVEKKGFRYLVEAAASAPGVCVAVAGEGDLRGDLEARARRLGAPVRLIGSLDRGSVAKAYATADVIAVPSVVDSAGNVDGLPNSLLEALASGRAVVASRVAGIPDVLRDGVNGCLVPPADASALAVALRRLVADPAERARLGHNAREYAVAELSWETTAKKLEGFLAEAAALATH